LFLPPELAAQQAAQAPSDKDSTIRVTVDSVLVPVIVRDAQGRAIGNLTKDDFQIFDRGKPQKISTFTIETRAPNESATSALTPPVNAASGAVTPPAIPALDATPPRCTVLLFDDMHLNEGDLMRAKAVGTKLLSKPIGKREAVAVVSMSGSNSGLMQDSAKLQKAVAKLHLTNLYRKFGPECPDVNYVEADRIMNKHDGTALDVAMANYATCSNAVGLTKEIAQSTVEGAARHVLELGSQDARFSVVHCGCRAADEDIAGAAHIGAGVARLPDHDARVTVREVADSGHGGAGQCDDQRARRSRVIHHGA
jgi:VWFA-related protein